MIKNLPIIFLIGLAIIFILFLVFTLFKTKKSNREGYVTTNGQFINRILNSPLTLEAMLEAIQPIRNSPFWENYRDLKDIIETLKSPNFLRFENEFIGDAFRTLNKVDSQRQPKFSQEVRDYIFQLITNGEAPNIPVGWGQPPAIILPNNPWLVGNEADLEVAPVPPAPLDDEDLDDLIPPFPQDININLIPQPFLPPQQLGGFVWADQPLNAFVGANQPLGGLFDNNNLDFDPDEMN